MAKPAEKLTQPDIDALAAEQAVEQGETGVGEPSAALGAAVGRGVAWSMVATVAGKTLSFLAQIVLGWYLSKDDFGVYAIAMGAASFAFAFRDGGLWNVLIARGVQEYETISGAIFRLNMLVALTVGLGMIGASPVLGWAYGDTRVAWLIAIIGLSWPISAPCWVQRARLVIDLRFRDVTTCTVIASIVRYVSMIACALAGLGPLSFVLPLIFTAIADNITALWLVREKPWKRPARRDLWPSLLAQSGWCIAGTIANATPEMGVYLVMGAMAPKAAVGVYYFAYQLVAQTGALLAANVQAVLLPAMSRIKENGPRRREAALRSLRCLMLISAPASVALAVVFEPVEQIVWQGKWAEALGAVLLLGAAYPMRAIFVVPQVLEMSRGGFKNSAIMTLLAGGGQMIAAGIASRLTPTASGVAMITSSYLVLACVGWTVYVLARVGVSPIRSLVASIPSWLVALAAGGLGLWAEHRAAGAGLPLIGRAMVAAGVFGVAFLLAARLLLARPLWDLTRALPARVVPPVRRLLLLSYPG